MRRDSLGCCTAHARLLMHSLLMHARLEEVGGGVGVFVGVDVADG